ARKRDRGADTVDDRAIRNGELVAGLDVHRVGPVWNLHAVQTAVGKIAAEDFSRHIFADEAHAPYSPFHESPRAGPPVIGDSQQFLNRHAGTVQRADYASHRATGDYVDRQSG